MVENYSAQAQTAGFDQINEAASFIRDRLKIKEKGKVSTLAIVLGSGHGAFAQEVADKNKSIVISYSDIPNFPTSSIVGHNSCLIFGYIEKSPVLIMQGRVHGYEGYSAAQVAFPVRVLHELGVKTLILTNASGAISDHLDVGDFMLITDHINMTGDNPVLGPNDLRIGPRFFDMSEAYSKELRLITKDIAKSQKVTLKEGVYVGVLGPCYETPAEIKMFKTAGADAVGMSTVFETIAARHASMEVVGIACMTNKAAGISKTALNHQEVTEIGLKVSKTFSQLLFPLCGTLAKRNEK